MTAKPIPDDYHSLTPYLTVRGAAEAIDFFKRAFGAQITHEPLNRLDGTIMHAEVKIGNSRVMIADESEMAKATTSTVRRNRPWVRTLCWRYLNWLGCALSLAVGYAPRPSTAL